jgi:hypothetical protein
MHQRAQRELVMTRETADAELDGFLGSASTWVAWTLWELVRQHGAIALTLDDRHGTLYVSSRGRRRIETFRRGADRTWSFTLGLAARHLGKGMK